MRRVVLALLFPLLSACSTGSSATPLAPPSASGSAAPTAPTCAHTVSRDASGVITANGTFGILGDTYARSSSVNDSFLLVRRGAKPGDQLTVTFANIDARAPASRVFYSVAASSHPSAWGDVAFPLGVKPIGFANSCWSVLTDAGATEVILEIGP